MVPEDPTRRALSGELRIPKLSPRKKNWPAWKRPALWNPAEHGHLGQARTTGKDKPPSDLAERLFELTAEMAGVATTERACEMALNLAMVLIPCEAGCVVRGGVELTALRFIAAAGPAAAQVLGQDLPYGAGVLGACFETGLTIEVRDVAKDRRHWPTMDQVTGFQTRGVLCSPVRSGDQFYGAIELINPPERFHGWHIDVLESLCGSLAARLMEA